MTSKSRNYIGGWRFSSYFLCDLSIHCHNHGLLAFHIVKVEIATFNLYIYRVKCVQIIAFRAVIWFLSEFSPCKGQILNIFAWYDLSRLISNNFNWDFRLDIAKLSTFFLLKFGCKHGRSSVCSTHQHTWDGSIPVAWGLVRMHRMTLSSLVIHINNTNWNILSRVRYSIGIYHNSSI